jgi:Nis1 family
MRFSIPVLAGAVLAFSQYVSAEGLTGIKLPASITPGEDFNVTYTSTNGLSNLEEYTAIYGITNDVNVTKGNTIGSQPFTTADLSNVQLARAFNVTIKAPPRDHFQYYADQNNGKLPQPWYISSANMQQIGASGGVSLLVFHASTTINY